MKKAAILSIGLLLFAVPWTARSGQAVSGPDPASGENLPRRPLDRRDQRPVFAAAENTPCIVQDSAGITGTGGRVTFTDPGSAPAKTYRVMSLGAP